MPGKTMWDRIDGVRFPFAAAFVAMSEIEGRISYGLTIFQVIAMLALSAIDVAGVVNVADFMVRPDGSQQDPDNMLPVEKVMVTMIAFPFLTIALAFLLAPRKEAALIGAATHGLYTLHQGIHYKTWLALFHPDTDLSMEFFIVSKLMWVAVSLYIWYVETKKGEKAKQS